MADRAFQRNAADPKQVRRATRLEEKRERRFLSNLGVALRQPVVRAVLAEYLDRLGLYKTSFDHSGSVMYFNEGRRHAGLELRELCGRASEELLEQMDAELRAQKRVDAAEVDAGQLRSATEPGRALTSDEHEEERHG